MGMAFCRLTEQLSSEPGSKVEKELRCLERTLGQDFSKYCGRESVNLIDLGTGDGQKMLLMIEALNKSGVGAIRYVPVDTNHHISRYAILTILGSGKKAWSKQDVELLFGPLGTLDFIDEQNTGGITIETLVWLSGSHATRSHQFVRNELIVPMTGLQIDFFQNLPEVVTAAKAVGGKGLNIFCMLGNTFGNYLPEKRKIFLDTLYHEMETGELFLLGISLRPKGDPCGPDEVRLLEREYLPGEAFMRLGADHPRSKYCSRYDARSCRMIHSFERPDKSIQEVGYSYLFDPEEIVNAFEAARLEVLSCEPYPSPREAKELPRIESEPKYLTILARKPQG